MNNVKKGICVLILIIIGMLTPEIVQLVRSLGENDINIDAPADEDSVRVAFCRNPNRENLSKIWEPLIYQGNSRREYDLFPYEWYAAFNDSDYKARYTIYRMLVDTVIDKDHYVPNIGMTEFANIIKPQKK